jgi:hypothetical protein
MDFRIVRSFLPMPFKKGFRITSSEKLEGNSNPGSGAGGWGHAIFHSYASDPGIETFTGAERRPDAVDFSKLEGGPELDGASLFPAAATLKPGASLTLFSAGGEGVVQRLRLKLKPKWSREALRDLWLRCYWEDEKEPAVNLPFGTFFGNEHGAHELKTYAFGFVPDGFSYQRLPMPFWRSARIELVNRSASGKSYEVEAETLFREGHFYERQAAGHLRASPWRPPLPGAPGQDAVVADIQGHGHAVAGVVARLGGCEGDIRVHIDGRSTPSVQSDGSESWACYGWGYYSAPEANPFSAYDGPNGDASMARSLLGDLYPFRLGLRLSAEPGCGFRTPGQGTVRTGSVFWYGEPGPGACVSDVLDVGDPASEKAHRYRALGGELFGASGFFEGAQDDAPLADVGRRRFSESSFVLAVDPANEGVLLRRRASQAEGRHRAFVEVDGVRVAARAWLWPDRNPYQLWLEDEFQLPAALTAGKRELSIRILPQELGGSVSWNECRYTALSLGSSLKASGVPMGLPGKELPPLPKGEASF